MEAMQPYIDYLNVIKSNARPNGVFSESLTGEVIITGEITISRDNFDKLVHVICLDEPDKFNPRMFVVAKES